MNEQQEQRFVLTQADIAMLQNRRAIDEKFEDFMRESMADRRSIRKELEANTRTIYEMHTALFAKDDNNEFGITGLVVNMQNMVKHQEVLCNIAKFFKWLAVAAVSVATGGAALIQFFSMWGVL